ncbi:tetratricopeptide repeat protein [Actinoplanes sp. NPDC048967]|uniref:tetratricopeptide repeat protein n=1 Tax=Actinoplanes sp. NPDC048967 TaxID=3155269 RepID=UPI0033D2D83F
MVSAPEQTVVASAGFAYGVVGADLHVFGDGSPLYLLEEFRPTPPPDPGWLRELPSRMLDARSGLVPFTGREAERAGLREWLGSPGRLAVRWLSGPGGQGKTRLLEDVAEQARAAGWKVVVAGPGVGAIMPSRGSQDLRTEQAKGVLVLVDYADRWPLTSLLWLSRNALLHRPGVRTRILLAGRGATNWPALRSELGRPAVAAATSRTELGALAVADRPAMYAAARTAFARVHDVSPPPGPGVDLDGEHFGLTLAVHLAALVEVDARANDARPETDPAKHTQYLLDREHLQWTRLHEGAVRGLDFATPPSVMARTVFTAALTGALPDDQGKALLTRVEQEMPAVRILRDHGVCYPSSRVLQPLLPDRLAEDYLALTLTGGPEGRPWSGSRLAAVLTTVDPRRPLTFLIAAAARWPHVGPDHLYPLLRSDPTLAVQAGSEALAGLAAIADVDLTMLAGVADILPRGRHVDLDDGIAAVSARLLAGRLAGPADPAERARVLIDHTIRLHHAGRHEAAVETASEAVELLAAAGPDHHLGDYANSLSIRGAAFAFTGDHQRALKDAGQAAHLHHRLALEHAGYLPDLATSLMNIGTVLAELGRDEEAVAPTEDAAVLLRRVAEAYPERHLADLAGSLINLSGRYLAVGRRDEASRAAEEATAIYRGLVEDDRHRYLPDLANALGNQAATRRSTGRRPAAHEAAAEALAVTRELARSNPAAHRPALAVALHNSGACLGDAGRYPEALAHTLEAIEIREDLVRVNAPKVQPLLATSLSNAATFTGALGRIDEAVTFARRALELMQDLVGDQGEHVPQYAGALQVVATHLQGTGRHAEASATVSEALRLRRRLAETDPVAHRPALGDSLARRAAVLREMGRHEEALADAEEAVGVFEHLIEQDRDTHLVGYVAAVAVQGLALSELGRHEEAVAAGEHHVALLRGLARDNPERYEGALATALNNLSVRYRDHGRPADGMSSLVEAHEIFQRRWRTDPAGEAGDLAMTAANLGAAVTGLGRPTDGLTLVEQALLLYRDLAAKHPDRYRGDLATTLNTYAAVLSDLGRVEDALRAAEEGVGHLRELAARDPDAYEFRYAVLSDSVGLRLAQLGRHPQALGHSRIAVSIFRSLAARRPQAHLPHLAQALNNLGLRYVENDMLDQSLLAATEALAVLRSLPPDVAAAHRRLMAEALTNLGTSLGEAGRNQESLPLLEQAVVIRRRIAAQGTSVHQVELAICLNSLAVCLIGLDRAGAALPVMREAVAAARQGSPADAHQLVQLLCNYALVNLDRGAPGLTEAVSAVREGLEVLPGLHPVARQTVTPAVAVACRQLHLMLRKAGRDREAAHLVRLYQTNFSRPGGPPARST